MVSTTIIEPSETTTTFALLYIPVGISYPAYLQRDQWLILYTDKDIGPHPEIAGLKLYRSVAVKRKTVVRARERRPSDRPPGLGYNALMRIRGYVDNKPYRHHSWHSEIVNHNAYDWRDGSLMAVKPLIQFNDPINHEGQFFKDVLPRAEKAALVNLYGSLQKRQDLNLGVLLVELKESIGTIGRAALAIAETLRYLKSGKVSKAIRVLRDYGSGVTTRHRLLDRQKLNRLRAKQGKKPISAADYASNMWLELQFGWKPILNDILGLVKIINGSLESEAEGVLAFNGYSGWVDFDDKIAVTNSYMEIGPGFVSTPYTPGYFSAKGKMRVAYNATYKVKNDLQSILMQLGLFDPLSTAWEVIPFSFVIDWFIPIGNWLNSLQADAGLELQSFSISRQFKYEGSFGIGVIKKKDYNGGNPTYEYDVTDVPFTREKFDRIVMGVKEIPPLPLPHLTFDELLQPFKVITILSLLR